MASKNGVSDGLPKLEKLASTKPQVDEEDNAGAGEAWLHKAAEHIPFLGIILSIITSVLASTSGLIVKVTHSVHIAQISVLRAVIQLIFYSIVIRIRGIELKPARGEFWPVLGRSALCGVAITASYCALRLISLGDATVLRMSLPIWTLTLSYFALGESCGLLKISAVAISLLGVVMISKPDDCIRIFNLIRDSLSGEAAIEEDESILWTSEMSPNSSSPITLESYQWSNKAIGTSLATFSSVCLAFSFICLKLSKSTPVETIIFWVSFAQICVGTVLLQIVDAWRLPDNWLDALFIILVGALGILSQWLCSITFKIEDPGIIALVRTFDIEVAFLYSALLHEPIEATSIMGAVLVSYGVIAAGISKLIDSRRKSKARPIQNDSLTHIVQIRR